MISGRMETALTVNIIENGNMDDIFGDIFGDMFHGQGGSAEEDGQASEADFPEIPDSGDIRISAAGRTLDGAAICVQRSVSALKAVFSYEQNAAAF